MVDILVRNVDQAIADRLKQKAKADGKSLSETARDALESFAKPSRAEMIKELDSIRAMSPHSDVDSTALIREDRDNDEPYR